MCPKGITVSATGKVVSDLLPLIAMNTYVKEGVIWCCEAYGSERLRRFPVSSTAPQQGLAMRLVLGRKLVAARSADPLHSFRWRAATSGIDNGLGTRLAPFTITRLLSPGMTTGRLARNPSYPADGHLPSGLRTLGY